MGLFFLNNQSIELSKLNNFCSICVRKIFTSEKVWIRILKNFVDIFSLIFGSRRASAPFGRQIWKWNHEDNHTLSTCTENFSFIANIILEEKSGQRDPLKLRKFAISQNRKWRHQNKNKVYQIFMIIYQFWKFHDNRPNRFREILCTKSVRKRKNKNREKETIQ